MIPSQPSWEIIDSSKLDKKDLERFWSKVKIGNIDDCWPWIAGLSGNGYPQINIKGKIVKPSRLSWNMVNGDIPKGKIICHTCDNKLCVNPKHLYAGSHSDNLNDRQNRNPVTVEEYGRHKPKLYKGEVWLIRKLNIKDNSLGGGHKYKFPSTLISKMFNVSPGTILRIWNSTEYLCKEGYYV